MNTIKLSAQVRTAVGKTGVKATRAEGLIPAVVYGNDEPMSIAVTQKEVKNIIYTPDFHIAEIEIDGKVEKCILKDVQFHPVTDAIVHIDFLRLKDGVPIKVDIPVRFKGESPGVKNGGKLIQQMRKIRIKTTPENLIDEVVVDISHLKLKGVLRVRDIIVNDAIEVMANGATPLATVETPRALKSAAAAEAKLAGDGDEGEGGEEGEGAEGGGEE